MPPGAHCPTSPRPRPTSRGRRARSWWTSTPRIRSSGTATGPAWRSPAHGRSRRRRRTGGWPGASSTSDSDLYISQLKIYRPAADTRHVRHLRLSSTVSRRIAVALALQTVAVGLLATGALGTSKEAPQVAAPQPWAAVSVDSDASAPLADVPATATDAPPALPELERQTQATVSSEVRDPAVQRGGADVTPPPPRNGFRGPPRAAARYVFRRPPHARPHDARPPAGHGGRRRRDAVRAGGERRPRRLRQER